METMPRISYARPKNANSYHGRSSRDGALAEVGSRELVLVVGLLDVRELEVGLRTSVQSKRHAATRNGGERAAEVSLPVERSAAADPHALAEIRHEVLGLAQRSVHTRRGDLE